MFIQVINRIRAHALHKYASELYLRAHRYAAAAQRLVASDENRAQELYRVARTLDRMAAVYLRAARQVVAT